MRDSNIQLRKVAVKVTPARVWTDLVFVEKKNRQIYWVMHSLDYFSEARDPIIYDPSNKMTCECLRSQFSNQDSKSAINLISELDYIHVPSAQNGD